MSKNTVKLPRLQTLGVHFNSSKYMQPNTHYYRCPASWDIEGGDQVIVNSPSSGFTIVKVVEVLPNCEGRDGNYKFVVSKIDTTEYDELMRHEREMREALAEQYRLKAQREQVAQLLLSLPTGSKAHKLLAAALTEMAK